MPLESIKIDHKLYTILVNTARLREIVSVNKVFALTQFLSLLRHLEMINMAKCAPILYLRGL